MLSLSLLFAGCDKYDDSAINGRVDNLEDRVGKLEELARKLTSNIGALQESVTALEKNDRITDVRPLEDGSGFIVVFEKAGEITVRNGKSSSVSVRKDADGIYYWTVDGEYLVIDGEKIPATAQYGAPHIKIEDGKFWFSVDDTNWTECGDVATEGIGTIKGVSDEGDSVVFTLYDDSTISIPKVQKFGISIADNELGVFEYGSAEFRFTVSEPDENTMVKVIAENGFSANVYYYAPETEGSFTVMAPESVPSKTTLLVVAMNGKGTMAGQLITLEKGQFTIVNDTFVVGKQGGDIKVSIKTNVDYEIYGDPNPNHWVKIVEEPATKAVRTDEITFRVEPYIGGEAPRSTQFRVMCGGQETMINITQLNSGGFSDFETFKSKTGNDRILEDKTDNGWVLKEGTRPSNVFLPKEYADKGVPQLIGFTNRPGTLTSPLEEDGIGTLKFSYCSYGRTVGQLRGFKFYVDVLTESGELIKRIEITKTLDEVKAEGLKHVFNESVEINKSGNFRIVITNACLNQLDKTEEDASLPSLYPDGVVPISRYNVYGDNVCICEVSWSGWSE